MNEWFWGWNLGNTGPHFLYNSIFYSLYLTWYQIIKPLSLLIHVTSLSFLQNTFFCYFFFVHTKSNVISLFTVISNIYDSLTSCIKSTKHSSSIPTHYLDSTECSAH